jgi:high-affinity nickel-transport protein
MTLFDAADGVLMTRAYGWASLKPVRKVFNNLTVTVLSVAIAIAIGALVLAGLVVERLGIETGPLAWVGSLDLGYVGFAVVGVFVAAWVTALAVWRLGRIEERWS